MRSSTGRRLSNSAAKQATLMRLAHVAFPRIILRGRAREYSELNVPHAAADNHVTVVGGGAAGLTAAFFAAQSGAKVTVLERTKESGKKILMSGGSRCNVLPVSMDIDSDFFTEGSSSAMRAVFKSWSLERCKEWLEDPKEGVGLRLAVEEETNKYFPESNSAREVRDKLLQACLQQGVQVRHNSSVEVRDKLLQACLRQGVQVRDKLLQACLRQGVQVRYNSSVEGIVSAAPPSSDLPDAPQIESDALWGELSDGSMHKTQKLVVCTGGLSFPKVGTDGTGHRILASLGHKLKPHYPALTPLKGLHPAQTQLAGLSLYNVDLQCKIPGAKKWKSASRTGLLFTHRGWSGPAILDLSHYAVMAMERGDEPPVLKINWTRESVEVWQETLKAGGPAFVSTVLHRGGIPSKLADALCEELGVAKRKMSELKKVERAALLTAVTAYQLPYENHEGYKKAEVTGGGVPLSEINCATMESRVLPGVYLCGEVCDVFGRIGGFNFTWAWMSGRLAGLGASGNAPVALKNRPHPNDDGSWDSPDLSS
eukprot:gene17475-23780_t